MTRHQNSSSELAPIPGRPGISKVLKYAWKIVDLQGVFQMVSKHILRVDKSYQRDASRCQSIASTWSWMACGTLLVAKRTDSTLWVFDGQRRREGAMLRQDIDLLPCMIYDVGDITDEAMGFLRVNTNRSPVASFYRFNAGLIAKNEVCLAVQAMIHNYNYKLTRDGKKPSTVSCIASIEGAYRVNKIRCSRIWSVCMRLCNGDFLEADLFNALFYLEGHLERYKYGSMAEPPLLDRLLQFGAAGVLRKAHDRVLAVRKGGVKVLADGVLDVLNHRARERNRIPTLLVNKAPPPGPGGEFVDEEA